MIFQFLADRRGLSHFLRSNHSSVAEMATRSRRASRSATSERMHSVDYMFSASQRLDHLQDMEHKRVIDNFVVRNKFSNQRKTFGFSRIIFLKLVIDLIP
jgi:hypothetical protein